MSGIVPMYYEPVHFRPCLSSKQGMVHFVVFFHNGRFFFCPISTAVSNLVRVMFALTRLIAGNSNNYKIITKKSSSLVSINSKKEKYYFIKYLS